MEDGQVEANLIFQQLENASRYHSSYSPAVNGEDSNPSLIRLQLDMGQRLFELGALATQRTRTKVIGRLLPDLIAKDLDTGVTYCVPTAENEVRRLSKT